MISCHVIFSGLFPIVNINEHHTQTKAPPATQPHLCQQGLTLCQQQYWVSYRYFLCVIKTFSEMSSPLCSCENWEKDLKLPKGHMVGKESSKDVSPNCLLLHQAAPAWTQCGKGVPEPSESASFPGKSSSWCTVHLASWLTVWTPLKAFFRPIFVCV